MLQGSISRSCANVLNILVLSAVLYRNLVTFGSPHQGVFGIPECEAEVPLFLVKNTFTQGGKSPSLWAGAPVDLAWSIRALDPGLKFLRDSFHDFLPRQDLVAPAQYWHDPFNQTHFLVGNRLSNVLILEKTIQSGSHYLADLNNERESKNETYKEVLAGLDNLVLVMWDGDTTIIPKVVALQIKIIHTLLILKSIRRSRHILVSMPWSRTQR